MINIQTKQMYSESELILSFCVKRCNFIDHKSHLKPLLKDVFLVNS
jgi:hypothetical protein